jgi:hypothetical protein
MVLLILIQLDFEVLSSETQIPLLRPYLFELAFDTRLNTSHKTTSTRLFAPLFV